ncbi:MAG TPA: hypothetical protein VND64_11065 [Pirellulales bacterium]|nr:hypothetical protein [Pirellulales bacterium]
MNRRRIAALVTCVWLATNPAGRDGWGQEPPVEDTEAAWREVYLNEAQSLQLFAVQGEDKHPLTFHAKPVMRWVSFNGFNGDVFVWLNAGRPEVVGNIVGFPAQGLRADQRYTLAELHGLSTSSIEAAPVGDGQNWKTRSGIVPLEIPKAPAPGETERERKRQAREVARDFTGWLSHYGEKWKLRMLDKPLYEYGPASSEVLGGALFAFVAFRTDPELLLLVEARKSVDAPQWVYLPVRFSQQDLWLKHREVQVWESLIEPAGTVTPKADDSQYRVYDNKLQTLPSK